MMLHAVPYDFTATGEPRGGSIRLTWSARVLPDSVSGDGAGGGSISPIRSTWSGRMALVKHPFGFAQHPDYPGSMVLFDVTIATEEADFEFVDDGAAHSAEPVAQLPVSDGSDWVYAGPGLPGAVTYYYSLFFYDTNDCPVYDPRSIFQSAYALGQWGHSKWLRERLPRYLWAEEGTHFNQLLETLGQSFDGMKTEIDRIGWWNDHERIEEDMLVLLYDRHYWPVSKFNTTVERRRELLLVPDYLRDKGTLRNFRQISLDASFISPRLHREWRTVLHANSGNSPRFIPGEVTTEWHDFGTAEYWITMDGATFWGALSFRQVTVIKLPMNTIDAPEVDDYFLGNKIVVESDEPAWAFIAGYRAADHVLVLSGVIDVPDNTFVRIMLGTPRLSGAFSIQDKYSAFTSRDAAVMRTMSTRTSARHTGLFVTMQSSTRREDARLATAVRKLQDTESRVLSGTTKTQYLIRPKTVVELIPVPTDGSLILDHAYVETIPSPSHT